MAFQELTQRDWSGGINAVTHPRLVTDKQCVRARNLLLDEHGTLSTRPGYSVLLTSTDTQNPIVYLGVLNLADGTATPFHIQNDGTTNTIYNSTTLDVVGATTTGFKTPQSVTVLNQEVFAMGYEIPWVWSGTAWTRMTAAVGQTVPPGAKHLAFHLSRLFVWNTAAATTTLDGNSSLRQSDANNVNSWPNANQTFISRDDGQQGMGLAVYTIAETGISPTTTLIAFKDRSGYQVTGTLDTLTFTVQKLKSDMGCIAPRSIQFVSGFGIIRLTHKGFALFNGVDDRLISEEVRPYIFGSEDITSLSFTNVDRAWATQVSNPPLYVCACPVTGPALNRVFVYDLVRRAWSICDFPITLNTLVLFTSQTAVLPVIRAGASQTGQIVRLFTATDTTDNGVAIPWSLTTKSYGSDVHPTYWRRMLLDLQYTAPQTVTVQSTLGGVPNQVVRSLSFQGLPGATYGTAVYGTDVYSPGRLDFPASADIQRTATWVNYTISGTGNVRVRGVSSHVAAKPARRLSSVPPV